MLGDKIGPEINRIGLTGNSLDEILEQVALIEKETRMTCKIAHLYAQGSRHYCVVISPKKIVKKKKVTKKKNKKNNEV